MNIKSDSTNRYLWPCRLPSTLLVLSVLILNFVLGGCGKTDKEKFREAIDRNRKAIQLYNNREYQNSLNEARAAIALSEETHLDSLRIEEDFLLANIFQRLAEYDSAQTYLKETTELCMSFGNKHLERRANIAMAEFLGKMEEWGEAISITSTVATTSRFFNDSTNLFASLKIMSKAYHATGQYAAEIKILGELEKLDSVVNHNENAADILEARLNAAIALGEADRADEAFGYCIQRASMLRDTLALTRLWLEWGTWESSLGQRSNAFDAYSQALELIGGNVDPMIESKVLLRMGNLSFESGNFENAQRFYSDVLDRSRRTDNIRLQLTANLQLLACQWKSFADKQSDVRDRLLIRCKELVDSCTNAGYHSGEVLATVVSGLLSQHENDSAKAAEYFSRALELKKKYPSPSPHDEADIFLRVLLHSQHTDLDEEVLTFVSSGARADSAFIISEQKIQHEITRFAGQLSFKKSNMPFAQELNAIHQKQQEIFLLQEEINDEFNLGMRRNNERLRALRGMYASRIEELSTSISLLRFTNPALGLLAGRMNLNVKEMRDSIPLGSALIEYAPTERALLMFVLLRDTVYMKRVPVGRAHLLSLVTEYNDLISSSSMKSAGSGNRLRELSFILHTLLVDPIQSAIDSVRQLYIVLPDECGWLPLHTLQKTERGKKAALIERFEIKYLPSAALLLMSKNVPKSVETVIGFGYPGNTGWDVEYEVRDIRAFYDKAMMVFGSSATMEQLKNARCDVFHVAADVRLDRERPEHSFITLSGGTAIAGARQHSIGELLMNSQASTIVFSDISSTPGGMIRYMPLLLLGGGTQTVVASMWQGERKSKKYFGEVFYTSLLSGTNSTEAYRQAMIALANKEEFASVQRWGLYFCYGK